MVVTDLQSLTDAVNSLDGTITGMRAETQELHDYGRRNRKLIRRQWVIGGIVALLVAWTALIGLDTRATARRVQKGAESSYAACLRGNEARKTTRDLWGYILDQPPIQKLSPEEEAKREALVTAFRAKLATSYADQDCSKLAALAK
jgi:hypothetical protein